MIRKTFKYRLYPNKTQAAQLDEWLYLNRELYNAALEERREAYKRAHKSITLYEQYHALPAVREARPEFYAIPISVLRGTLKRLDLAFQAFFRRVKAGQTPGFPRFQGKHRFNSFVYLQNANPKFEGKRVSLSMLGSIKIVLHRPIEGAIKTVTIQREGDQWYICFSCEVPDPIVTEAPATAIGLDLGVSYFATLSTGEQIANPRYLQQALTKLATKQQALSRCQRGSHRRNRARRAVARAYQKVRNQRQDFLHKLSRRLVNEHGTLVMEALQPANLSKRAKPKLDAAQTEAHGQPVYAPNGAAAKSGLNRSIMDAAWATFQQMCTVKAAWAGRHVLLVNPAYTSQTCSGCGQIRKKELSERWHSCECGTELDRDHNAAINILRLGINTPGLEAATAQAAKSH